MPSAVITHAVVPNAIRHPRLDEVGDFPRPRYKGHWAVGSRDLARSDVFYEVLTGTKTICRPASFSTAVSWDDEHHRFFIADMTAITHDPSTGQPVTLHPGTPQDRTGIGLASIRYASREALAAVYRRMDAAGWTPEHIVDRGTMVSLVYKDPSDLLVEAFATFPDRAPTEDAEVTADVFLASID